MTNHSNQLFLRRSRMWVVALVSLCAAVVGLAGGADSSTDPPPETAWWSLQAISRPTLPPVRDGSRLRTAIDSFIQAKLEANHLSIGPEADRRTLLRRLKFDLHGLPPTPQELTEFERDAAPDAYERLVDRLLNSPHYGERWGRHWLDVVRFSESKGYERDRIRENAWRFRDWVIRALNDDMPYRDFVREQLAGDAIHPDDPNAAVATGFLVTGPNNDVGNQSQVELMRERADELDEIVQNVTSVFLGLTVGCARCHDHKFDPVPSRDYYRIAAVFSGVKFGDRPMLAARESAAIAQRIAGWDARLKEINQQLASIRQELESLGGAELNVRRNEERFEPVETRVIRLTITATKGDTEPCIDEIELYGPDLAEGSDPARNLAYAARGAKASASSLLPGYAIHQIPHLNDGLTGNDHSWISNEKGKGWAQIELAASALVSRVIWGRDRDGKFTDRLASEYRLEYSTDGDSFHKLPTIADRSPADTKIAAKIDSLKLQRKKLQDEKKSIDEDRANIDKLPKTWAALSNLPAPLKVLRRGDVLTPGEDATPGSLAALASLGRQYKDGDIGVESNDTDPVRRLKLADWITHPENPLTWRVLVNRVWQYHFGAGLVTTPSDFGAAGSRPSHPELLDWLADEFRSSGGRLKALNRTIVRSATYRQAPPSPNPNSSTPHSALRAPHSIDSENRLLWRPNRRRLDAETLRDSILAISGKLSPTIGGPSYRTFKYIEGNIPVYEPLAEGPDTWRRTVYRHLVRTHRQPFLDTFDCPDPSVMTPTRTQTTTPLQALSLLNNLFIFEQSHHFAERVTREAGPDTATQARTAFRLALLHELNDRELETAIDFIGRHGLDGLCRVLFNTNEFLYVD